MFLGVVGLLVFLGSVVWLIWSAIKKRPKKKILWTMLISFIVFMVGAINSPDSSSNAKSSSSSSSSSVKSSSTKKKVTHHKESSSSRAKSSSKVEHAKKASSSTSSSATANSAERRDAAVALIQSNYKGIADVGYDYANKAITIKPTSDAFAQEVLAVYTGEESTSEWDNLTSNISNLSEKVYEDADTDAMVAIVNPDDSDKVLYAAKDGTTVYDFMHDN